MKLNAITVFAFVVVTALLGMVLGGLFGWGAGELAPKFFASIQPWQKVEPIGTAIVFGATAGVLLGGGLGVFAMIVQLVMQWKHRGQ